MMRLQSCFHSALWALTCLAVAGCGTTEQLATVSGKVVEGGQPVAIEDYEEGGSCLEVEFFPVDEAGQVIPTKPSYGNFVQENGSFVVEGLEGLGIPEGKYRVAVRRIGTTSYGPGQDVWEGKFEADRSPFSVDVPATGEVVIDLAQAASK